MALSCLYPDGLSIYDVSVRCLEGFTLLHEPRISTFVFGETQRWWHFSVKLPTFVVQETRLCLNIALC